ncbi:electron transport complex subunit RsxA [Photobacterium sp. ZSDE20]|uniref:Ion-translocating oxidoreductase complex subunit A n=1 Tax=Photobacterium pectinilyticum TaxID=2906793 RepID=A0ABT1N3A9_9GAMM|nr:electron transport complex subunit RsxA [Photobacterium sp. ZSDE20]MCQ1058587.1 electron transport complex subunit RsxA [Photobacterium sp. ZSDE20]MDD1826292.1 electron transport complex subunit RsxA [Photobacterium sp. ZSDE20]
MDNMMLFFNVAFVNNVVLAQFLGLCPFMGVSGKVSNSIGMGLATTFVITVASILAWLLDKYLLVPNELTVMRIIAFIVVIAAVVQITEMYIQKSSPSLYKSLGVFLPLITTNCAVLGVALIVSQQGLNFFSTLVFSLGSAVGFTVSIILFSGLRQQLSLSNVPAALKGSPIAFITAGVMSMAFMGFAGMAS